MKFIRFMLVITAAYAALGIWFIEPTKERIIMYGSIVLVATFLNIFVHRSIVKKQKRLA